jgi:hypothetical protein
MELFLTIGINPFDYTLREHELPQGSSAELPDEWNEFW